MILPVWPFAVSVVALAASAAVLVVVGYRFARTVDALADRTGMGEALAGALMLGVTTSLPGLITTVVGAAAGEASFAVSNAMGGIAAQTMFIALADLSYPDANLEHAAASEANVLQVLTLLVLGGLVMVAITIPEPALLGLHPVSPLLAIAYIWGLRLARHSHTTPMWRPRRTPQTRLDEPDPASDQLPMRVLWWRFAWMALVVGATGFVVSHAGLSIVETTAARGSLVGGVFTSVITSLPELVTVLAAVRIKALTLALGDIIGGNTFDVLFLVGADLAYRDGSVFAAVDVGTQFLIALSLLMTAVLAVGMVARERTGLGGIGHEGVALIGLYGAGVAVLSTL